MTTAEPYRRQVRFPRSKRRRVQKKWRKRPWNFVLVRARKRFRGGGDGIDFPGATLPVCLDAGKAQGVGGAAVILLHSKKKAPQGLKPPAPDR